TYTFPSIAKVVFTPFPPFFPSSTPEIIRFRQNGPDAQAQTQQPVGNTIDCELQSMNLSGNSPDIGPVTLHESPSRASLGQITVTGPGNPISGNSFFDVFVELTV